MGLPIFRANQAFRLKTLRSEVLHEYLTVLTHCPFPSETTCDSAKHIAKWIVTRTVKEKIYIEPGQQSQQKAT